MEQGWATAGRSVAGHLYIWAARTVTYGLDPWVSGAGPTWPDFFRPEVFRSMGLRHGADCVVDFMIVWTSPGGSHFCCPYIP